MKKQLEARYLDCHLSDASAIPALFGAESIEYNAVDVLNWPEAFPYLPEVRFAMAYCPDGILVHYKVSEQSVRAEVNEDFGHVWEDSCVEFFSAPEDDGLYYNIECTCVGKLWIAVGKGRDGREFAPKEVMSAVSRWTSLGSEAFGLRESPSEWEAALIIPLSTYFKHSVDSLKGKSFGANFYKCGDKLPVAHFATWNPIVTPKPDYHSPEFFGTVKFK